jgi:hypothetical protein
MTESNSQPTTQKVAFVSGPLDPDDEYFATHYAPKIDSAIAAGHSFIMGPVAGVDTMALHYLLDRGVAPTRITVYMAHFEYASTAWRTQYSDLGVNVRDVADAVTTRERDAAMTKESDYDILRYRTEEEAKKLYGTGWWPRVSNTEINERRRRGVVNTAYRLEGSTQGETKKEGGRLRERVIKFFK